MRSIAEINSASGTHLAEVASCPRQSNAGRKGRLNMGNLIWIIVVVLIVLWLLGAFVMPVGGGLIHILIVIALILVVWRLATGRKVL